MVEKKRRRIASKPITPPPEADNWVSGGGRDPEVLRSDVQTAESLNISTSKAKSSSKDYIRTTVYLTKDLHRRLKRGALDHEMEMSDIAEAAIEQWLDEHSDV